VQCEKLVNDGILLLAPTGKARVRLGRVAGAEAMTIAQFLYGLGRYDGVRQRPLFEGKEKYRKEKTVVIDECSMLTMDTLYAVLESLDLGHVQRLILVGDPNQLPPIGVGRPFADFVGHLDRLSSEDSVDSKLLAGALARLTVEVRAFAGAPSDTLRLASWFTAEPQPIDADRVLSDLELGGQFNDLEICFWRTPQELHTRLLEQFQKHLGLSNAEDAAGFNCALGCNDKGLVVFENPDGAENFQILSPVRMHPHGVYDLNRWIQRQYRKKELEAGRQLWGVALGDEEIVIRDKVIQLSNERRVGYHWSEKSKVEEYLANGEIGMAASSKSGFLNVVFAGRANITFGYSNRYDFRGGKGPIELAYALTIHKAQGSEFRKVFVVLPKNSRLISRELLYTALTRAKERLILLMEGDNIGSLYDLTRPEQSETARRYTNLFETEGAVRENSAVSPYADHLIHRTDKGHMVRSKSELVIANMLHHMNIPYEYERQLEGTKEPGKLRPDFTFIDASGEPIIWEHLGMLGRADYAKSWEWKKAWYQKNAFVEGKNLFTTTENDRSGLDSAIIRDTVNSIKVLL
jgi:ATP-dependent exoDNAse (exonuclease V) alpha subunit